MSKIYEALKQAEQQRAAGQRDASADLSARLDAEYEALRSALEQCQAQLDGLATQIASAADQTTGQAVDLQDRLSKVESESAGANHRVDRTAETFASAVATLHARIDQIGQRVDAALNAAQQEVGHLRSRVDDTLGEWNKRVEGLVAEVRSLFDGDLPGLDEVRRNVMQLEHRQEQSSDSLRAALAAASVRLDAASQQIEALSARMNAQADLLQRTEASHATAEASVRSLNERIGEIVDRMEMAGLEQEAQWRALQGSTEEMAVRLDKSQQQAAELQANLTSRAATLVAGTEEQQRKFVATLEGLQRQVEALAAEKAALREAIAAQGRQIAEAMQVHRSSLTAAIEAQIEPLRAAHGEASTRLQEQTKTPASPSGLRIQKNRANRPETSTPTPSRSHVTLTTRVPDGSRRRPWLGTAAFCGLVLAGVLLLSRLMTTARGVSRSGATAQSFAGLQDPVLADRFASGVKALQHGEYAAAEKAFGDVIAARPGCVEARNNLAVALDEQRRREAAIEQLREALRIQPDYERARTNLERLESGS
ncbi:MAG: tetratricopeptide repeat protein [Deltaproteobacteria bacterium]|nr:tetratricopeptide repeat protein [Deltaproteobacteria bacterium]